MTDRKFMFLSSAVFLLTVSNVLTVFQVSALKKSVLLLETAVTSFGMELSDFEVRQKKLAEGIELSVRQISDSQEENQKEMKGELSLIRQKSESQFSRTVRMAGTYDAILEEQKKKTVDTAEKDSAFLEAKKHASELYGKKEFEKAYAEFNRLSKERYEDMECLSFKTKSLFYMNMADSSKYKEILSGIKILRQNAAADDECLEIERAVLAETEGLDE
ncbi:MAG: hypothetical protein ACI4LX_05115 [Treponema sp.]